MIDLPHLRHILNLAFVLGWLIKQISLVILRFFFESCGCELSPVTGKGGQ